ncbi:phosphotransferase family protein [Sphaerisporangium fuscum]|uniref:phosphotransferase family protein n=1 Tax=Sphaerisporangium fuscum TaxID=2835868 RepID=UPI001BDD7C19|nr:aminoglycoside phosphotransferase family protein [Sphaerisporangium fuscum]
MSGRTDRVDAWSTVRGSLARHLPGYETRSVAPLGEGLDNVAYEVGGELVVRASKEPDPVLRAEAVRREAALLTALSGLSTLPVPEPVFADEEAGILAYTKLPGLPLFEHPVAEPARLAERLGGFLHALHRAPVATMERLVPRDDYSMEELLEDAGRDYGEIAAHVPAGLRGRVEEYLGTTPPPAPEVLVFCHNDLGAEHILVDPAASVVTGVIDWTDAAVADPAYDLGLILRDLGPEVFELTLTYYEGPFDAAARARAAFYARCSQLEDIAYGLRHGIRAYVDNGLAALPHVF